ncbi:unnamed protein product, partial [Meganyctiphanes norvegica]
MLYHQNPMAISYMAATNNTAPAVVIILGHLLLKKQRYGRTSLSPMIPQLRSTYMAKIPHAESTISTLMTTDGDVTEMRTSAATWTTKVESLHSEITVGASSSGMSPRRLEQ